MMVGAPNRRGGGVHAVRGKDGVIYMAGIPYAGRSGVQQGLGIQHGGVRRSYTWAKVQHCRRFQRGGV